MDEKRLQASRDAISQGAKLIPKHEPGTDTQIVKHEPGEKLESPGGNEFARMLSQLRGQAKQSAAGQEELQKFQLLKTHAQKRHYYWNNWVQAHPKVQDARAHKRHRSTKQEKDVQKDFGWVELGFVAQKKGLLNYSTCESERKRLEFYVKDLESKPHPGDEDAKLFHYFEVVVKTEEGASESLEFEQNTDLAAGEYEEAVRGIESGPDAARRRSLPSSGSAPSQADKDKRNKAKKGQQDKKEPEWMQAFKKSSSQPWAAAKRSCDCLLSDSQDVLADVEARKSVKAELLAKAYVQEVDKANKVFAQALQDATAWRRRKAEPASEAEAAGRAQEYEHRLKDLKRHKDAFKKITDGKLKELREFCENAKKLA